MSSNAEIQKKLRAGVEAARRGDRTTARNLLEQVVQVDETNELAWLWLASSVNNVAERRACLERVLQINPNNQTARQALDKLGAQRAAPDSGDELRVRQNIEEARRNRNVEDDSILRRREAAIRSTAPVVESGGGISVMTLAIVGGVVIAVIILGLIISNIIATAPPPEPTATAVAEVVEDVEPTATTTPLPTFTSIPADMFTAAVTLPPTFTPTAIPSATVTPTATPEPVAVSEFPIVYASQQSETQTDLYIIRVGEGEGRLFLANATSLAFSPDGSRIVFTRTVDYGDVTAPELFVANVNGDSVSGERQLTQLRQPDTGYAEWAPEGDRIAFSSSGEAENSEIWTIGADGENLERITESEGTDIDPTWSPDGTELIFASDPSGGGFYQLVKMNLASGETQQITVSSGSNTEPLWVSDDLVLFVSTRFADEDIFVTDSEGLASNLITIDDESGNDRSPSLSPDGRWVAFITDREGDLLQTYVTTIDGRDTQFVAASGTNDTFITFRPLNSAP